MSDNISIFNPGVGISGIVTPRTEDISISGHKGGMSPALSFSGNEKGLELYNGQNLDSIVERYLQPESSDPELMTPHRFQQTVQSALEKLGAGDDSGAIRNLHMDTAENSEIVRMFTSLVISG
ncbi:MAG: hypothetical protein HQK66_03270 [Desulfamplus sp.]|nr:hypothetical protein [Desulfamplus sp.]